jgi:hypothetical protein
MLRPCLAAQRDRQAGERPLLTRETRTLARHREVALEVEQLTGGVPDHPEPLRARLARELVGIHLRRAPPPLGG